MNMSKDSPAKCYQVAKKDCKKKLVKDNKVFPKQKKKKKWHYGPEQYKNLPENEKQTLVEYRKVTSL